MNELKAKKVINKLKILLPGVVVFVFTKFQRNLSTLTSSDLILYFITLFNRSDDVKVLKLR